jgi:phage antirepressor YoqD-like protein
MRQNQISYQLPVPQTSMTGTPDMNNQIFDEEVGSVSSSGKYFQQQFTARKSNLDQIGALVSIEEEEYTYEAIPPPSPM